MLKSDYIKRCRARYAGAALADALSNYKLFAGLQPDLGEILAAYRRDPWLTDLSGRCHNQAGDLKGALWQFASGLGVIVDFEEHYQTYFLRRGLLIYCQLLQEDQRAETVADPRQILAFE